MKKTLLTLIGLTMILQLVQCSSSTKPAAKLDPAVEACTKTCTAAYVKCIQKAGKSESKKSACTSSVVQCSSKCETKAKGYKKEQPDKSPKYSEL